MKSKRRTFDPIPDEIVIFIIIPLYALTKWEIAIKPTGCPIV
jgi:hypothetical protein